MREIDRNAFTGYNHIESVLAKVSTFVSLHDKATMVLKIYDETASLYVSVNRGAYRREYNLDCDYNTAKLFVEAFEQDTHQKVYKYSLTYGNPIRILQYEGEKDTVKHTIKDLYPLHSDPRLVIQDPVITGPDTVSAFDLTNYHIVSKILHSDSLISSVLVDFDGSSRPYYILPNAQSIDYTIQLQAIQGKHTTGTHLPLGVTVVDNKRHYSFTTIKDLTVYAGTILTPVIETPVNASYIPANNISIVSSPFKAVGKNLFHTSTNVQIKSQDLLYETLTIDGNFTQFNITLENDLPPGVYYIRVQYVDRYIGLSEWSPYVQVAVS